MDVYVLFDADAVTVVVGHGHGVDLVCQSCHNFTQCCHFTWDYGVVSAECCIGLGDFRKGVLIVGGHGFQIC